jgi:tetratricopeptide (TPR) repeat protein
VHVARLSAVLAAGLALACVGNPDKRTLADLHGVEPDLTEVTVEDGLAQAMEGYESFLEEAPESALTPEAMRRLADLKLEQQYGYLGGAGGGGGPTSQVRELPAPDSARPRDAATPAAPAPAPLAGDGESQAEFERRAAAATTIGEATAGPDGALPGGAAAESAGPLEAIALYDRILETYPSYEYNDWVLYQKARAFDELGRNDEAIAVIERLIAQYPTSRYIDEVQFRRAEYFFVRKRFLDAEEAYLAITARGPVSEYYELALYKLGWALYKQEMYPEAVDQYIALLDYKVSVGYDFEQSDDEADERRIADTFRVISLSFSSIGGPETIQNYFASHGQRTYEDRIYSQLGEFYLEKLRYSDAAAVYEAFVELHPMHRVAPRFSMRVIDIYEAGGFPKLVLESKKDFASRYGLASAYWTRFDPKTSPEVVADLKVNLEDLATHYHAVYQEPEREEEKPESFREALHWYRAYLASFPQDPETPGIHYRLADLLLEDERFGEAALEYERIAYQYPPHDQSAAAGYAAIFAHRESEKRTPEESREIVTRQAVTSTIRFVDTFPEDARAPVVLGAAVDDLYALNDLERALATAQRLIDAYPESDPAVRRAAWGVVANASFDLARFDAAEQAYLRVLEMTPEEDESRQAVVDSLAASIYKQGEEASAAGDDRTAADHFLRIAEVAPTSSIRASAEYDAGAALIRLEDWSAAAAVLETFRRDHPDHGLNEEATKQIARIYREQGDDARAAGEYERVADEADDPELRREALLLAGDLYESAGDVDRAIALYERYVSEFPEPLEAAVETRYTIAGLYEKKGDDAARKARLKEIVRIDAQAAASRTPRIRYLAARSALALTLEHFERFQAVKLTQPFEKSLQRKQALLDTALKAFESLVDYEVAEVTAAATFYIAEIYFDFSQSLMQSERPAGLGESDLLDYEMVLEEEAFPFEERAIEVHEKNLELLSVGVYNGWVEKSLGKLATLMPGRYAKFEASPGLIPSIDRYAYQAPAAPLPTAEGAPGEAPETGATPEIATAEPEDGPVAAQTSPGAEDTEQTRTAQPVSHEAEEVQEPAGAPGSTEEAVATEPAPQPRVVTPVAEAPVEPSEDDAEPAQAVAGEEDPAPDATPTGEATVTEAPAAPADAVSAEGGSAPDAGPAPEETPLPGETGEPVEPVPAAPADADVQAAESPTGQVVHEAEEVSHAAL